MIATTLGGGLGNQMFMYAMARAMSLRNGSSVAFNLHYGFDIDEQFRRKLELLNFNVDMGVKAQLATFDYKGARYTRFLYKELGFNILAPHYRIVKEKSPLHYQQELLDIHSKNVYLDGYWQCEKYFADYEDQIRKDFKIVTPISDKVKTELHEMQQGDNNLIFIGIRRYQECKSTRPGMVLDEDYYNHAIELVESKVSSPKFVVFTQQPEWAKEHLHVNNPIMFAQPKNGELGTIGDLYLMTHCHHAIISNSSFYWWGAWLIDSDEKIIVSPNNFINVDSPCDNWIRL